jgi:lipopolysaccharide transport system permease protein
LLTKIYFPRLIVPVSSAIVSFVDFLFAFVVMVGMMVWYRYTPSWTVIALPLFLALAFAGALGAGLWFAALNVKYRDFRFVVPFLVQFGLFVSPVGFSSDIVPESWRSLYSLNPLVGVIEGFRWAILGGRSQLHFSSVVVSFAAAALILLTGVHYFRTTERRFADLI